MVDAFAHIMSVSFPIHCGDVKRTSSITYGPLYPDLPVCPTNSLLLSLPPSFFFTFSDEVV